MMTSEQPARSINNLLGDGANRDFFYDSGRLQATLREATRTIRRIFLFGLEITEGAIQAVESALAILDSKFLNARGGVD